MLSGFFQGNIGNDNDKPLEFLFNQALEESDLDNRIKLDIPSPISVRKEVVTPSPFKFNNDQHLRGFSKMAAESLLDLDDIYFSSMRPKYLEQLQKEVNVEFGIEKQIVVSSILNHLFKSIDLHILEKELVKQVPGHIADYTLSFFPLVANFIDFIYEEVDGRFEDPLDELEHEMPPMKPDCWTRNLVPIKDQNDASVSSISVNHQDDSLPVRQESAGGANPFRLKTTPSSNLHARKTDSAQADKANKIPHSSMWTKAGLGYPHEGENFSFVRLNNKFTHAEIAAMTRWEPIEVETIPIHTTVKQHSAIDDFENKFREEQAAKERAALMKAHQDDSKVRKKGKHKKNFKSTYDYNGSQIEIEEFEHTSLANLTVDPHCSLVPLTEKEEGVENKKKGFFFKKPQLQKDQYAKYIKKLFTQQNGSIKRANQGESSLKLASTCEAVIRSFQPEVGVKLLLNNRYIKSETAVLGADAAAKEHRLTKEYLKSRIEQAKLRNRGSSASSDNRSRPEEYYQEAGANGGMGKDGQLSSLFAQFEGDNISEQIYDLEKFRQLIGLSPTPLASRSVYPQLVLDSNEDVKQHNRHRPISRGNRKSKSALPKQVRFKEHVEREASLAHGLPNIIKIKTETVVEQDLLKEEIEARTRMYLQPVVYQGANERVRGVPPVNKTYRVLRTNSRAKSEGVKIRERRPRL